MTPTDAARRAGNEATLHPEIEPYASGRIALDALHTMHWETSGNPAGVPLVFLHGGPGGGCLPHHRRFYDPDFFRTVNDADVDVPTAVALSPPAVVPR